MDIRRGIRTGRSQTGPGGVRAELLERQIDETARLLMTQDPTPHAYAAVFDDVRKRPPIRFQSQTGLSWVIAASGCTATALLALVALQTFAPAVLGAQAGGSGVLMGLRETSFARWINESGSLLGYPGFLFFHSLGLAVVVGISTAVNLRLIGFAPGVTLASVRALFPVIWLGFAVSALSGAVLFIADASGKTQNPMFEIKLVMVALGVLIMALIQRRLFRVEGDLSDRYARRLAVALVLVWLAAIVAGRLVAYAS